MAIFGLGAPYPRPLPLRNQGLCILVRCYRQVYKVAGGDCREKGDCSVGYQVLERIGVLFWSSGKDHYRQRHPVHEPHLHAICSCPRMQDLIRLCGTPRSNGQAETANTKVLPGLKTRTFDTLQKHGRRWIKELPVVL